MARLTLKGSIRELLVRGDLEGVADVARERTRTLGSLVALTFDSDVQVVWRAIEAMGLSVEALSHRDPRPVKEHMRRLCWLASEESGGVLWRAPECMAECSARLPRLLGDFIPIAFHLLETLAEEDLEHFRPGALWAVGRLGRLVPGDLPALLPLVVKALDDPDPQARGMAAWCLGEVGEGRRLEDRQDLRRDPASMRLYRNRIVEEISVGDLVREILGR
jgi:hypothetical protein